MNQQQIQELKNDIDDAMELYRKALTKYARRNWLNLADKYAHQLAKLTNWYA